MSTIKHNYWDGINHPYGMLDKHYNENGWNLVKENKISVWGSFDSVDLSDEIDWNMDPFVNDTWSFYFNGLNWLYSYIWGVDKFEEKPDRIFDIILQYYNHINSDKPNKMAWFDHATSDRLSIFTAIMLHPFFESAPPKLQSTMKELVLQHIDKIIQFKDSKNWVNSNHGIFHALSLLNAAGLDFVQEVRPNTKQDALAYLSDTLLSILSTNEYFSLEQSAYYHQLAINLLQSLDSKHLKSIGIDKDSFIMKMIDANYWITNTEKKLIAIGDTSTVSNIPEELAYKSVPEKMTNTFTETGFSIAKYESNNRWNHFSFLHRSDRAPHGHFDALSITLSKGNKEFLIDSGGPYSYGNPLRFKYFMSSFAHNVAIIDGKKHEAGAKLINSKLISNEIFIVEAEHSGYFPVKHTRKCVYVKNKGLAVIDSFTNIDSPKNVQLLWHVHPDCTIDQDITELINKDEKIWIRSNISSDRKVVSGIEGDNPQGWITPGIGVKEPCPTIIDSIDIEADTKVITYFEYEKGFFDSFEHIDEIEEWNIVPEEKVREPFDFNSKIISKYISNNTLFWKTGTYFEDRNIWKINKSQQKLNHLKLSIPEKSERIKQLIEYRIKADIPTIYIISNGGSGCHYLGGLISMKDNFRLIDEVYIPQKIIENLESLSESSSKCLLEMINFVHLADLQTSNETVPVNTMHLRKDVPLSKIKEFSANAIFVNLIRNPFDIAISRGLRKSKYKEQNLKNKEVPIDDYLKQQAISTKNHFKRLVLDINNTNALTIKFEDLISKTRDILGLIFAHINCEIGGDELDLLIDKYENTNNLTKNKNKSERPDLSTKQKEILIQHLSETSADLGYEVPEYCKI